MWSLEKGKREEKLVCLAPLNTFQYVSTGAWVLVTPSKSRKGTTFLFGRGVAELQMVDWFILIRYMRGEIQPHWKSSLDHASLT